MSCSYLNELQCKHSKQHNSIIILSHIFKAAPNRPSLPPAAQAAQMKDMKIAWNKAGPGQYARKIV